MCGAEKDRFKFLGYRLNRAQGLRPAKKEGVKTKIFRCRRCGIVFPDPMPVPVNLDFHYNISPADYWDNDYLNDNEAASVFVNHIKDVLEYRPGLKALDVGSGFGQYLRAMLNSGFDAYGIEPSTRFCQYACENGIPKDRIFQVAVEDAVLENNSFDFIFLGAILEHVINPSETLKKCVSWLKQDGLIYVQVPSSSWLTASIMNTYYRIIGTRFIANLSPMHPPYHLFEFSLASFRANGIINNYAVKHFEYAVCQTYFPKFLDGLIKPLMRFTNTGMEIYVWLKKGEK
ncbi:TPA: class I SAM-dependent methyltransferase [bacterium]|nr:class I SAM-dependent methyltransferase [bacterium]